MNTSDLKYILIIVGVLLGVFANQLFPTNTAASTVTFISGILIAAFSGEIAARIRREKK